MHHLFRILNSRKINGKIEKKNPNISFEKLTIQLFQKLKKSPQQFNYFKIEQVLNE